MLAFLRNLSGDLHQRFAHDMSDAALTAAIILIAMLFIVLALVTKNKWVKAGILAYMILP